jgi:gliding motility-associated-like protein
MRFFLLMLSLLVVTNVYPQCANTFRYALKGAGIDAAYDLRELPGGDIIIGGQTSSFGAGGNDLFLTRMTKAGNVVWSKAFGGSANETFRKMILSRDSNILITGQSRSYGNPIGRALAMKIDMNGNVIWSVTMAEGSEQTLGVDIFCASDNSVIMSGSSYGSSSTSDWLVTKIDISGNVVWYKRLDASFTEDVFSVVQKGDTLIVNGDSWINSQYALVMAKMSFADGTLYNTRAYQTDNRGMFSSNMLYANGQYRINTHLIDGGSYAQKEEAFVILDTASLSPLKTFKINATASYDNHYFTGVFHTPDGGFIVSASPSSSNETSLYRFDQQSNLVSAHRFSSSQSLILSGVIEDSNGAIWLVGSEGNDAVVMKLNNDGEFEYCANEPVQRTTTPITFNSQPFSWTSESFQPFLQTNITPTVTGFTFQIDSLCTVPVCGQAQITGPVTSCNLTDSLTYVASNGGTCLANWQWILPTGLSSRIVNDSTVRIRASAGGTYNIILENISGCSVQRDTLAVTITPSPRSVQLGNDTLLCSAATLVLDAGTGFDRYQWQDNSSGRTFTVSSAGTYFVRAWNSCNEMFTDTVRVSLRSGVNFQVTPQDTTYCTPLAPVQLSATGGHMYQWSPATFLDNPQINNPVARPDASITYNVTITDTVCNITETLNVNITITPSPRSINLGNDTTLCNTGAFVLDAGAGFARYQWQDNNSNQTYSTNRAGTYYVTAWNSCNEAFSDTMRVSLRLQSDFSVSPLDTAYCTAVAPIRFAATGGDLYQWSPATYLSDPQINNPTGSPDASIVYTVTITDTVCNYSRDMEVNVTVNAAPSLQLTKSNDLNCAVGATQLSVTGADRYEWLPDATLSALDIANPVARPTRTTTYIVKAYSVGGCVTEDSITVNFEKTGIADIYLPTAFTPNRDGRNDIFRVVTAGSVEMKELSIFNRWGELIFTSNNASKGWDGTFKGVYQESGAYYWFVRATSPCGGDLFKKGQVILIK